MIAVMVVSIILIGCTDDVENTDDKSGRNPIELTPETRAMSDSLSGFYVNFTTDMAKYVDKSQKEKIDNLVVSPLSAAMLFAMTANGMERECSQAYLDYLGINNLVKLNELCGTLIDKLPKVDNSATLKLANSIWVNKAMGVSLNNDFHSTMSEYYKAETRNEDFDKSNSKTIKRINDWCANKTNNLITQLTDNLNPESYAILLNALYFKAIWEEDFFNEASTKKDIFHGSNSDSEVQMMVTSHYYYGYVAEDEEFEYVMMPFNNYSFIIHFIVPKNNVGIEESAKLLTPDRYQLLLDKSTPHQVKAYIPKFSIKGQYNLNEMLDNFVSSNLTGNLNMSMFDKDVNGNILYSHATSFSIDETGAKAAVITSGDFVNSCLSIDEDNSVVFKADSPFYFFITEKSTGACILSGRIANL